MTIKHIVISGGGPTGIKSLGALKHLYDCKIWEIENIKSIYATSAGVLLSVLILLRFDFETIINYIINRPWHEVYKLHLNDILEAFTKKGILSEKSVEIFFKPFFDAKDINLITMTLEEFFNITHIDLHIMTFEINDYKTIDISHKTHPQLLLTTAVKMSISIPILFTPVCMDGKCYIDGGVRCNYPLKECLNGETIENMSEVLGIRNAYSPKLEPITDESNILDFVLKIIKTLVDADTTRISIENEIVHDSYSDTIQLFNNALHSAEFRNELLECGIKSAKLMVESIAKTEPNCL